MEFNSGFKGLRRT